MIANRLVLGRHSLGSCVKPSMNAFSPLAHTPAYLFLILVISLQFATCIIATTADISLIERVVFTRIARRTTSRHADERRVDTI